MGSIDTPIVASIITCLVTLVVVGGSVLFWFGKLSSRVGNSEGEVKKLRSDGGDLQTDVTRLKTIVDHLDPASSKLESKATDLQIDVTRLKTMMDHISPAVSELESKTTDMQNEVTRLKTSNELGDD